MSAVQGTTTEDLCAIIGHWLREYDPPVDPPLAALDARTLLGVIRSAGWGVVDLPEVTYRNGEGWLVFAATVCDVQAIAGTRRLAVWLQDLGSTENLRLDADEARSLAAALLAAADASEATP